MDEGENKKQINCVCTNDALCLNADAWKKKVPKAFVSGTDTARGAHFAAVVTYRHPLVLVVPTKGGKAPVVQVLDVGTRPLNLALHVDPLGLDPNLFVKEEAEQRETTLRLTVYTLGIVRFGIKHISTYISL